MTAENYKAFYEFLEKNGPEFRVQAGYALSADQVEIRIISKLKDGSYEAFMFSLGPDATLKKVIK